jgi:hypothetical protein
LGKPDSIFETYSGNAPWGEYTLLFKKNQKATRGIGAEIARHPPFELPL